MNKIIVACYCRVSTKKEEQEMSLENQQKFFEDYAKQNNLEVYRLYKDDGISAKSMKKRDDFNRMVRDAKKGLFSQILVKDVSRFARNTLDFLGTIKELKDQNIEVKFITANMSTYDSALMLTMLAAVAEEESANLSKRVKFAKQQSAKEGRVPGVVYGYDKIPKDRFNLSINQTEARVVERIFHLYVDEQMGAWQIAKLFNGELVPTKRGGTYQWSQTVVRGILKNPIYIGQVCNGKTEVSDYKEDKRVRHEEAEWIRTEKPELRIISDEQFNRAEAVRISRSNSFSQYEDDGTMRKRRPSIKYPLSNLLRCANDNYCFRRRVRTYEPSGCSYTYWSCNKRDSGVSVCNNAVKIDEHQMEQAVVDFLMQLFSNREVIRGKFKSKISKELHRRYDSEYSIDGLIAEQKKLHSNRDKLMDLYLDDSFDKETLKLKSVPIDSRLKEIETIIKVYHEQDNVTLDIEKCLVEVMDGIDDHLGNLMDNAFLKSIFERFVVYPDGKVAAYIKLDKDTGETMEIPFCEIMDKTEVSVPKCTPAKHRAVRA